MFHMPSAFTGFLKDGDDYPCWEVSFVSQAGPFEAAAGPCTRCMCGNTSLECRDTTGAWLKAHLGDPVLAKTSPKCKKCLLNTREEISWKKPLEHEGSFVCVRWAAGEGCPGAALELHWSCTGAIRTGLLGHSIPSPPPFPRKAEERVGAATLRAAAFSLWLMGPRSCKILWALQRRSLTL